MRQAFEDVVGLPPKIDRKVASKWIDDENEDGDDEFGPGTTKDIYELLASRNGHDRRLDAFYSLKVSTKK